MSNLIPSLETFAKAGRPSDSIFPTPSESVPRALHLLYSAARGIFFFRKRYFSWTVRSCPVYLLYVLGDGRDGRGIGHARSVFTPVLEFICMNRPRAGMGLLYYGQNFLIYPSAFPAGARESAFTLCPLAPYLD